MLILTIIIMIILATAVILSLSSNGIISKAQNAKEANDKASIKEYKSVLEAEWELMTKEQREETGYSSQEDYVNAKLREKGFAVEGSDDEENYEGANEIAKDALEKGLKIGNEVKYITEESDKKEYTPDSSLTGTTNSALTTQTNLKWIYIGLSEEGELLITPDVSTGVPANSNVKLYGKQGYLTGPDELNTTCDKLYTVEGKGTARSMDIDDVTRLLGYTGEKGAYFNSTGNYVPTSEARKIGDIEGELGKTIVNRDHPGKYDDFKDYYSDYYYIDKTDDVGKMNNPEYVNLVIPKSGAYALASSCVYASFSGSSGFSVRYVRDPIENEVSACGLFFSNGKEQGYSYAVSFPIALRPVVSITSKIQESGTSGSGVWEFVS